MRSHPLTPNPRLSLAEYGTRKLEVAYRGGELLRLCGLPPLLANW
jgi:hypothetical protein